MSEQTSSIWRARIFVSADPTIKNHNLVHGKVKEMYNTYFADEECELVMIGVITNPLLYERLKLDVSWLVSLVDVHGRRSFDDPTGAANRRAIDYSINLGVIIYDGQPTEFQFSAIRELCANDVMTILLGV